MRIIYISFYSLTSRTRIDVVELIVRKRFCCGGVFVLWKLHFTVQSNLKIKLNSNALTKLQLKNLWNLWTAIINRPKGLQLNICHKQEVLSLLSSIKLVLIHNKCYQCKLVCTGMMNEWYKILTMKTLREVNRT